MKRILRSIRGRHVVMVICFLCTIVGAFLAYDAHDKGNGLMFVWIDVSIIGTFIGCVILRWDDPDCYWDDVP